MSRRKSKPPAPSPNRGTAPARPGKIKLPSPAVIAALLAVVTFGLYLRTTTFEFVNYDDNLFVTGNTHMKAGFSRANLVWAFTNNDAFLWHPLTWLSHLLDYQMFGLQAGGHHFVNVLLHTASVVTLFYALNRLTRATACSAVVAALFAWHPMHVQSVAWVAERKDVLSGLCWMLTLWSYARYVEHPGRRSYGLVLLCFTLGLLAKPMVVTLPLVLLLLDFWPLNRLAFGTGTDGNSAAIPWAEVGKLVREKIPLLMLAAIVSIATVKAIAPTGALMSAVHLPWPHRLGNSVLAYVKYVSLAVWPSGLAAFYPLRLGAPGGAAFVAALLLMVTTAVALRAGRTRGYFAVGWLWFLGTLVPVIGLVQNGDQWIADRYTYLPYIGLFVVVVWGVADIARRRFLEPETPLAVAAGLALAACLLATNAELPYWRNSLSLFSRAVQVTENNALAHNNLGVALDQAGKLEAAIPHYRAALQITPGYVTARQNLANALLAQGNYPDAAETYRELRAVKPDSAGVNAGLGMALANLGRVDEARQALSEAVRLDPRQPEAHNALGMILANEGKLDEAQTEFLKAIEYGNLPTAHNNLGNVLILKKNPAEAVTHYRAALALNPDWDLPLNSLAWLLATSPDAKLRDGPAAVKLAQRACALAGGQDPVSLNTLAAAYAEAGQFTEALATAREALKLALALQQKDTAEVIRKSIEGYDRHQPYRN